MTETTRGRKAVFLNEETINNALQEIQVGNFKSRYLTIKLVEMGLVESTTSKGQGRGRPKVVYSLTDSGKSRLISE
jgi:predicted ArsR family transcriptional regulator